MLEHLQKLFYHAFAETFVISKCLKSLALSVLKTPAQRPRPQRHPRPHHTLLGSQWDEGLGAVTRIVLLEERAPMINAYAADSIIMPA